MILRVMVLFTGYYLLVTGYWLLLVTGYYWLLVTSSDKGEGAKM